MRLIASSFLSSKFFNEYQMLFPTNESLCPEQTLQSNLAEKFELDSVKPTVVEPSESRKTFHITRYVSKCNTDKKIKWEGTIKRVDRE